MSNSEEHNYTNIKTSEDLNNEDIDSLSQEEVSENLLSFDDFSNTPFAQLFYQNRNPQLVWEPQNDLIVETNDAAIELYRNEFDTIINRKLLEIDSDLSRQIAADNSEFNISKRKSILYKKQETGSSHNALEVSLVPIEFGGSKFVLIEFFDIRNWQKTNRLIEYTSKLREEKFKKSISTLNKKRREIEHKLKIAGLKMRVLTQLEDHFFYVLKVESPTKNKLIDAGESLKKITGLDKNEIEELGGWSSLIVPSDLPVYYGKLTKLEKDTIVKCEYRILDKNGKVKWLRDYLLAEYDSSNRFLVYIMGIIENVTPIKKLHDELKISKETLRNRIKEDNIPKVVVKKTEDRAAREKYQNMILGLFDMHIYHDNGVIVDVNSDVEKFTQLNKEDLIKKTVGEFIDSSSINDFLNELRKSSGKSFELKMKDFKGTLKKTKCINITFDRQGRLLKLLAMNELEAYMKAD